jgi:hypothetical protein
MKAKSLILVLAAVALFACTDQKAAQKDPTGPETKTPPVVTATPKAQGPTICIAYQRRADQTKAALAQNPGSDDLKGQLDAYNDLIDNTCN